MNNDREKTLCKMHNDNKRNRRTFLPVEDFILKVTMETYPFVSWGEVAKHIPGRTARQCRDRWNYYLSPDLVAHQWTAEDDQLLSEKIKQLGTQWAKILQFFPGISYNSLKNRYYSTLKSKTLFTSKENYESTDSMESPVFSTHEITWDNDIQDVSISYL